MFRKLLNHYKNIVCITRVPTSFTEHFLKIWIVLIIQYAFIMQDM